MKKLVAGITLILFLTIVLTFGAAKPASAMTYGACYNTSYPGVWGVMIWENYNWWEETFLGKRDRWVWKNGWSCA